MKAIDVTRLRERRVFQGRKFEARPALFPGYCFVLIELQWHAARWAPGTLGLVMDGITPARVTARRFGHQINTDAVFRYTQVRPNGSALARRQ